MIMDTIEDDLPIPVNRSGRRRSRGNLTFSFFTSDCPHAYGRRNVDIWQNRVIIKKISIPVSGKMDFISAKCAGNLPASNAVSSVYIGQRAAQLRLIVTHCDHYSIPSARGLGRELQIKIKKSFWAYLSYNSR